MVLGEEWIASLTTAGGGNYEQSMALSFSHDKARKGCHYVEFNDLSCFKWQSMTNIYQFNWPGFQEHKMSILPVVVLPPVSMHSTPVTATNGGQNVEGIEDGEVRK
jgi:hypothetical protein